MLGGSFHVWPFLSFCNSSEGSKRSLCVLTSCQVNCFFSPSRCFPVQTFIAVVCIQVIYEKCQISLSSSKIKTLSNWREMLTKCNCVLPVFLLASWLRDGCLPSSHLCFHKQFAVVSSSSSDSSSWIPFIAAFDVVTPVAVQS